MHELNDRSVDEAMALPGWVRRPSISVQLWVGTTFILLWLLGERASFDLFTADGTRLWHLPAGLGVALIWGFGLRYAWAVVLSCCLGLLMFERLATGPMIAVGLGLSASYAATGWLLRRAVPLGHLRIGPAALGGALVAMLGGAMIAALLAIALLLLTDTDPAGDTTTIIMRWALADALGIVLTAPLAVMVALPWVCQLVSPYGEETRVRYIRAVGVGSTSDGLRAAGLTVAVAIVLALFVGLPSAHDPRVYYLGFIALPALAMRYRLTGGLAALVVTAAVGLITGKAAAMQLPELADLQLILAAIAISTFLVGWYAVMRGLAEERSQANHRWSTLIMRGSGLSRWTWDIATGRVETDYLLTDAFGYRRDRVEPTLLWWEQRLHPEDVQRNRLALDRLLRSQEDYYEAENRMMAADGSWGWYLSQGTVIERNTQGQPIRVGGTHQDITERRELEGIRAEAEATQRSEQRFRTLSDSSPVAIFQTNAKGEFLYVNPAWREMTGLNQTEALDRAADSIAHPADRAAVQEHWSAALMTETPVSIDHRMTTPDGTVRWLQTQAAPMNSGGVLLGYVGTSVDVTPYREAMSMIRDSEARYRTLADHAYDMLWRADTDGRFTYVSPSTHKLLGYRPNEMVGSNLFDYFHEDDLQRIRDKHAELTTDEPELHDLHRFRRADGSYLVFEAVGRLVVAYSDEDEQGETTVEPYIIGISRDVTQRVESQQIQKDLEEKLARSQKLDAIGTFATGIAHDFRNSLLAIKASAQSVGRKLDEDHPALPALQTVNDACAQAMQVTQSLLTFARGPGATKAMIDLTKMVKDNAPLLATVVPAGVELRHDCPDEPIKLRANAGELQQAMLNLVVNASDAITPPGSIAITLRENKQAQTAEIIVSDTGHGMSEDELNRALEPFYTTKARLKGTGLGLSQVHGIVTNHQGEVILQSKPNQGTTITLSLPLTPEPAAHLPALTKTQL